MTSWRQLADEWRSMGYANIISEAPHAGKPCFQMETQDEWNRCKER